MEYRVKPNIELDELLRLYNSVGWYAYTRTPETMQAMLQQSLWWCAAYENNKIVGLIRAVGDGVSIVYIQDILVDQVHQGKGIGRVLFNKMFDKFKDIRQLVLITENEEKTHKFYKSVGLTISSDYNCSAFVKFKE